MPAAASGRLSGLLFGRRVLGMITEGITTWHSVLPVFLPTALTLAAVGRRISQLAYGIEQIKVFLREPEVAPLPFGEFVARFHDRGLLPVSESAAKLKTDEAK